MVKGTTIGTVTDMDGNFTLNIPSTAYALSVAFIGFAAQDVPITAPSLAVALNEDNLALDEVVLVGYGQSRGLQGRVAGLEMKTKRKEKGEVVENSTINQNSSEQEKTTSVSYDIAVPYTVPTDGKYYAVDIKEMSIPASFTYYATPKLDKDVFLVAQVTGWEDYNLLEGEANLFYEDTYIGKTLLDVSTAHDTLNVSLGRDKSVLVQRNKMKDFSKREFIGKDRTDITGWEIVIRNTKKAAISLVLQDQFPVSTDESIIVKEIETGGAKLDPDKRQLTWKLQINTGEEKKVNFKYSVKYPKSLYLQLE